MANPSILIEQTGQAAGSAGDSRADIVIGSELQISDAANGGGTWAWTYVGPPDSVAVPTGLGTNDVRLTPDVIGTYLFYVVHDGTEYSYTANSLDEWITTQGGAAVVLPDGRRIPGDGETEQFEGGWNVALSDNAQLVVRLQEAGVDVPNGPFTKLNFVSIGGGQVLVDDMGSGSATVTVSGGGSSASALQTTGAIVDVSTASPPTTDQVLVATSPTTADWQDNIATAADAVSTTGTAVTVSTSAPPTSGQALIADSATEASWQNVVATVSGISVIRLGSTESYSSDSPLIIDQFELNTGDYPATAAFTFRAIAGNGANPLTSHVKLYNLTDGEDVAILNVVNVTAPILSQSNLTKGTTSGTLKATSKVYEVSVYVDSPVLITDTIEFGSAEIRVTF